MSGLTLAGLAVTSIGESQDPKVVELLLRENTRWIKWFHEKARARDEMFGFYTITDGDEQMEMSSSFPEADVKHLLSNGPASYHPSPSLSLAPSSPSAK